jgi:hypothetical protein
MSNLTPSFREIYKTAQNHAETDSNWKARRLEKWAELVKNESAIIIEINCELFPAHIECDDWDFSKVTKFTIINGKHIYFKKCKFKEDVNLTIEAANILFEDCKLSTNSKIEILLKGKSPELNIIGKCFNLEDVKIDNRENHKMTYDNITIKSFQKSKIKKLILKNIEVEKFICTGFDIDDLDLSESKFNIIKIANRSENNEIKNINLINTHFVTYAKFDNIFTEIPDFSNIISTGADNIKIHKIDEIEKCTANKGKQEEGSAIYKFLKNCFSNIISTVKGKIKRHKEDKKEKGAANKGKQEEGSVIYKFLKNCFSNIISTVKDKIKRYKEDKKEKGTANKDKQEEDPEKYIFLKNYYIKNNNYEEEMRFFRYELKAKNKDYLMRSYDFFSKCGTSIFRPFIFLVISFILFAFLNCYQINENICICKEGFELSLARTIFPLFKTSIFGIEANFEKLSSILYLVQSFINIILIFLLFLAVRNKFKIK